MKKISIPTILLSLGILLAWPSTRVIAQPAAGQVIVEPIAGLITTESGGKATFTVRLSQAPNSAVKVGIQSLDLTEGTVLPLTEVTFNKTNYGNKTVTITGMDDSISDGDILYAIQTLPALSSDNNYDGVDPSDVTVTNWDNEGGPVANPDTATTLEGQEITTNVLANDALNLLSTTVTVSTSPTHGTAMVNADNTITYLPTAGYNGTDSYSYQVCDTHSRCSIASVTLSINSPNKAPQAGDDAYNLNQDNVLQVPAPGVLINDKDDNQDTLTASLVPNSGPANGTLDLQATGAFTYTPNVGFTGEDVFNYQATDGKASSNIAVVKIQVIDTTAPNLEWVAPLTDTQVYLVVKDELVELKVTASDNVGVASVLYNRWDPVQQKYVDIDHVTIPPFATSLDTRQLLYGWNQVFARAADAAGNLSERQFIWFYKPYRVFVPLMEN